MTAILLWMILWGVVPLIALGFIVCWAIQHKPGETAPTDDDGGIRRAVRPRNPSPRHPRRGPHGQPGLPDPPRVRTARPKPLRSSACAGDGNAVVLSRALACPNSWCHRGADDPQITPTTDAESPGCTRAFEASMHASPQPMTRRADAGSRASAGHSCPRADASYPPLPSWSAVE
jgi:hypothetical protein